MFETPLPEISDARDQPAVSELLPVPTTTPTVAPVDLLALAVSRFGAWRAGAAALVERYRSVAFDLTTTKGYKDLTTAISEVRAPRFAAQNVSKASKTELSGISKAIGAEEAAVAAFLDDTEKRLVALRDTHDEKVKAEKAEAARVDGERIAGHIAKIATIKSFLARSQGLPSSRIALGIEQLAGQVYGPDWQEFAVAAASAQCETLEAMRSLHAQAVEREAAAALLEAQRVEREAEQARQAAENARVAAELAERQRAMDLQAAEFAANMARISRHQRRIDEIHAAATGHAGKTAWELCEVIVAVEFLDVSEGQYQEFSPLASFAQTSTLAALRAMHATATAAEALATASQARADEAQRADAYAQADAGTQALPAPILHARLHATEVYQPAAVDLLGDAVATNAVVERSFSDRCNIAAGCLPRSDYRTQLEWLHTEMLAEIERLRSALLIANGALVQCSPCASPDCQADQREWLDDAIAGCERALK